MDFGYTKRSVSASTRDTTPLESRFVEIHRTSRRRHRRRRRRRHQIRPAIIPHIRVYEERDLLIFPGNARTESPISRTRWRKAAIINPFVQRRHEKRTIVIYPNAPQRETRSNWLSSNKLFFVCGVKAHRFVDKSNESGQGNHRKKQPILASS